jgi:prepilin-type N-terminal cleavage/methylation domain-containing protein
VRVSKRDFTTLKTPSVPSHHAAQGGFTLVEIAVSLMVIGILMGAGMIGWASYIHNFRVERTQERMDLVMQSLSRYVQTNYRLPCPANPGVTTGLGAGLEGGSNGNCLVADSGTTASATYANMQGIVPWRTLGIPQEMTKDAWGRPFTYRPAPNLTVNMFAEAMRDTADVGTSSVHSACLNEVWYESKDASGAPIHVDRAKALFCCNASPNTNFLAETGTSLPANWRESAVFASGAIVPGTTINENTLGADITAPVVISNRWAEDSSTAAARMGQFNYNPLTSPMTRKASQGRTSGVGVTLISHGGDGFLAFITGRGAQNRSMADVVASGTANLRVANIAQDEVLNVWPPQVSSGTVFNPKVGAGRSDITGRLTGASDDMVTYARTDQIYGFLGDATCARPKVLAAITKSQTNPSPGCSPQPDRCITGQVRESFDTSTCAWVSLGVDTTFCPSNPPPPPTCVPNSACNGLDLVTTNADCSTSTQVNAPSCSSCAGNRSCIGGRQIETYRDAIDGVCKSRDLGCCTTPYDYCSGINRIIVNADCTLSPPIPDNTCWTCPPEDDICDNGVLKRKNTVIGTPNYCEFEVVGTCVCNPGSRCVGRDLVTTAFTGGVCSTTTQTNHPTCPQETCRLRPTPSIELLFTDTDYNKAVDYIYFDPSTRLIRDVPECTGAAGTDSLFDVVTKACTDSTVYGLIRANGPAYEVWGRKCEDCPTGQSPCMSADLTWTVGTMNCSARVPSANHNIRRSVTDTETATTPGTGTAAFLCNDGTFAPQPGATCTGDCPAMVGRTWGTTPQCAADLPAGNQGDSVTVTNTVSPQTGTATYSCNNGSWVETSATCNPAGCTLSGMYQWGPGNVCQGDGTGIFIPNGGTGSVLNATSGRTGKADFTCNNGVITPGPTTCDLQQCAAGTIPFGAGCSANVPGGTFGQVVTRPNTNSGFTAASQADFTCNAAGGWDVSNVVCNPIINGACNTTTTSTATYTAPAAGSRCSAGNETAVTTNATTFDWSCNSPNGGTNANCSAPRNIDGVCGSSSGQTFPNATPPSANLCGDGSTPSVTTNASTYTWTCAGVNSGTPANCSATRDAAPPSCNWVYIGMTGCSTMGVGSLGNPCDPGTEGTYTTTNGTTCPGGEEDYNLYQCQCGGPPPPTDCPAGMTVNWVDSGGSGLSCSSTTVGVVNNGAGGSVTDSTGPDTGSATFTCTNGVPTAISGTCVSSSGNGVCGNAAGQLYHYSQAGNYTLCAVGSVSGGTFDTMPYDVNSNAHNTYSWQCIGSNSVPIDCSSTMYGGSIPANDCTDECGEIRVDGEEWCPAGDPFTNPNPLRCVNGIIQPLTVTPACNHLRAGTTCN